MTQNQVQGLCAEVRARRKSTPRRLLWPGSAGPRAPFKAFSFSRAAWKVRPLQSKALFVLYDKRFVAQHGEWRGYPRVGQGDWSSSCGIQPRWSQDSTEIWIIIIVMVGGMICHTVFPGILRNSEEFWSLQLADATMSSSFFCSFIRIYRFPVPGAPRTLTALQERLTLKGTVWALDLIRTPANKTLTGEVTSFFSWYV